MGETGITTENTIFVILSFEGPDIYSQAGGLGVRVTHLSQTLAKAGFPTHLIFVGDPRLPGEETSTDGRLILHRWCQWISAYHPAGCYQGEDGKLADYNKSVPPYLLENIIRPAAAEGKMVVVLSEEWQTAQVTINLAKLLTDHNLRDRVVIFWNANNTFGFEQIDFKALAKAATITTVSRYVKHIMWRLGLNPVVIHNGIPRTWFSPSKPDLDTKLRRALNADLVLAKIARWDPDKRWNMAVEAAARLKARGLRTLLLARGGMEGYGQEILYNARSLGLRVKEAHARANNIGDYLEAIAEASPGADVLDLKFHCPQDFLKLVYPNVDAVLANSGREPFGLVGLETMATGGIAFTGSTGEDYAISFHNSIVLETSDPKEIESYVLYLQSHPEETERIRKSARYTAGRFTWEQIVENLIQRLQYQAKSQGIISLMPGVMEDEFVTIN